MIFLFFALLFNFADLVFSKNEKLLRINEWHKIDSSEVKNGEENDGSLIDLHLFETCERFSLVFKTENEEFTQLRFKFDDLMLKKIDIDSLREVRIPKAPKVIGNCRETSRKVLRINMKTANGSTIFRIADQIIRRPFDQSSGSIRILIPQNVSCCLIRALFLSNFEKHSLSDPSTKQLQRVSPRLRIVVLNNTTTSVSPAIKSLLFPDTETRVVIKTSTPHPGKTKNGKWSKFTIGKTPLSTSTANPKVIGSWTHEVNKQWSFTFVICSIIICGLMFFLVLFGIFMVFYLMTKPKGAKSPFAIDA